MAICVGAKFSEVREMVTRDYCGGRENQFPTKWKYKGNCGVTLGSNF